MTRPRFPLHESDHIASINLTARIYVARIFRVVK